jgi:hypothetical protein
MSLLPPDHVAPLFAEKLAFLAMLQFIYTGSFSDQAGPDSAKSWEELLQLLLVADVYQVLSVISSVASILQKLSENIELLQKCAFELPEHLHQYAEIESLMKEARASLFQRYKKVSTWNDSAFGSLSIEAISLLLQNDELQCSSEEEVFEQVLIWTRKKFETAESRERVMSELCPHLRFAHMSGDFLQERVIYDPDMRSFASQKHIVEGLLYRASSEIKKGLNQEKRFFERIGVEKPWTFEFTRKARVDAAGAETFSPDYESRGTKWCIQVRKDSRKTPNTVGVFSIQSPRTKKELVYLPKLVRWELSAKLQGTAEWTNWRRGEHIFTGPMGKGRADFFTKPWDLLMVDRMRVDPAGDLELKVKATVELVS